jgi:topoisomerase-4 subunit B
MYTDTARPNHLAQEVIDNAVDEALAGHARTISVTMHEDGSCEVSDDGRGMPVDIHPEEKIPGIELILTRLHAGGKFSNKNYTFSGGLHGVGVSVVNALSKHVDVFIKRDGNEYRMSFKDGDRASPLEVIGSVGKKNTGTRLRFWPDPKYFDTPKFNLRALKHLLRAKAVLCPGLTVTLFDEASGERAEWHYEDGLRDYLKGELTDRELLPPELFVGTLKKDTEIVDWAVAWIADGELVQESYVNLIPTAQHGTHVNGLRTGFTDALREFCDFRNLLPRGVKLAPEDVWDRVAFVLSLKMTDPQFSGQTKERLSSRQAAGFVEGAAHDAFSLWLNQHTEFGEKIAQLAIERASGAPEDRKADRPQEGHPGPGIARQAGRLHFAGSLAHRTVPGRRRFRRRQRPQARDKDFQAILPLRGKILNTWEVASGQVLASQEVHDLAVAIGCDPGKDGDRRPALRQGGHPRRRRLRRPAHRHPALALVPQALPVTGRGRPCIRGDAAAVPRRRGQAGVLRAGRRRKAPAAGEDRPRETQGPGQRHPLQGPGRDEPATAARIDHARRHPPPGPADRGRRRRHPWPDGYVAGEKARRRSQELAGAEGRPGDAGCVIDAVAHRRIRSARGAGEGRPGDPTADRQARRQRRNQGAALPQPAARL